ncbi:DoxX family protein [Kineococcus sp. SYSU DK001]|uniref:DoxX family protein n=1 Tax=Kineococcus sp. SYSU DK001 TaxID=3383122 RepID=UPI003D7E6FE3
MISAAPSRRVVPVLLFGAAGLAHLLRPEGFDAIVPRALPGPARAWTTGSGVAELALAAGFAVPRTRRWTARLAAAFLVAVWPANVQMALDAWPAGSRRRRLVTAVRVPLQVPLVRLVLRAGR